MNANRLLIALGLLIQVRLINILRKVSRNIANSRTESPQTKQTLTAQMDPLSEVFTESPLRTLPWFSIHCFYNALPQAKCKMDFPLTFIQSVHK